MKTKLFCLKVAVLLVILSFVFVFSAACGKSQSNTSQSDTNHPKVEIDMKDGGKMVLELYPEYAPDTVANFIKLAKSGFYDGLTFHRIMKGFMIQGGDPSGDGTGGSDTNIKGEFANNGFKENTLKHTKGVISMARSQDPDSASSQFFIMDGDGAFLDGDYAAFGKLVEGEKTLDSLSDTPVGVDPMSGEYSAPVNPVVIDKIVVLSE